MVEINSKDLEQQLKALVAEITEIEPEKITTEARFIEDLGMDSMMALEILASIEKKYKLRIPEDYMGKISSLEQLVEITKEISMAKK